MNYEYIYIRNHPSYDQYNVYKLGKTQDIIKRNDTYITGEFIEGNFILVIKVNTNDKVEDILQDNFIELNIRNTGGIEFYDRIIETLILPYLDSIGVIYEIITDEMLKALKRNQQNITDDYYKPLAHQKNVIDNITNFYEKNNIGKLLWSCGLGKTLLSIFIVQALKYKKILIGVPSRFLQKQFINEIIKLYPNQKNILCVGGDYYNSTTDNIVISKFIKRKNKDTIFIITTYHSCYLLLEQDFDFKIGDESHHLTGLENDETIGYKEFHKIKSLKTIYMTATAKIVDTKSDKKVYSMDDEQLFGKLIDEKTVKWAIDNKKITDYNLLILSNTENEITEIIVSLNIDVKNKELFMSAFMCLKAIDKYNDLTHVLICCNSTYNTELIKKYIDVLLEKNIFTIDKNIFYNEALHSNKKIDLENNIEKFKNAKYGIISSVYIFGEGFDLPKLNGVVFAENMISDIRTLQTSLRPNRLDKNYPDKMSYIIIPYMEHNDFNSDKEAFERVRIIVQKMRNVDEGIERKITISKLYKPEKTDETKKPIKIKAIKFVLQDTNQQLFDKINLRLKYSKALVSGLHEDMDEYNYVKELNKELKIKSKGEYTNCEKTHKHYIVDPMVYFTKKALWKNWYDFLGINTSNFAQEKTEWLSICKELNITSIEMYSEIIKNNKKLPEYPSEFYGNFSNIENELGLFRINKTRRH
jgi:predicted helicase